MERWRRWLREPLVIFFALGLAVFLLDRATRNSRNNDQREIEITSDEIERLRQLWSAQSARAPSEAELESLVEGAIEEEILVREARRLGLDHDDTIVRRRLAQKMSFLIQDTVEVVAPSERELARYFEQNQERYVEPARTTFSHIFFSNDRRGVPALAAAAQALADLRESSSESTASGGALTHTQSSSRNADTEAPDWRRIGDPFLLHREYAERTRQELAELFGRPFADALDELSVGAWSGPVASAYGQHLVRVARRTPERALTLDEVRPRLIEDFRTDRRQQANRDALADLRSRYRIKVEGAHADRSSPGETGSASP